MFDLNYWEHFEDDNEEETEEGNMMLIQEIFETVAEIYIASEGYLEPEQVELLNNAIEVLFFE